MRIIEQLVYKIIGDNSKFDKSIDKSEKRVTKFGKVADKIFAGVTVASIGMAVKKMGEMVISSATALDRVDKLSQKIGLSRTAFQEWDYILGQSGASVEGLQMGVKTLSNAADEARKGTALYAEAFDKLGVSVTDANGNMKDQETLFAEVFSSLADMENQTERTAIANKLLGRSAVELAPTFNTSKEGIEQLRREAHSLGLVYSDELVDAGVVLGDNIDRLKKSFGAWRTKALAPIIGVLVSITDKIFTQKTATSEMAGVVDIIKTKTAQYQEISETLLSTQNNLSDAERNLLLARKETLAFEIQKQLVSLASTYNETKDNVSELEEGVDNLNTLFDNQNAYLKTLTLGTVEYENAQEVLEYIYGTLVDKQQELSSAQISYNGLISEASKLVADGILDIEKLAYVNGELYNKIIAGAEAIEAERKATEDAAEAFKAYENATSEEISTAIKELSLEEKTLANGKLIELLQKKKIELAGAVAKESENLAAKEQARNEIVEAGNKAMELAEQYALALGSSYDLNAQKASILETTIKSLIDSGLTAEDKAVADLTAQLEKLGTTTEEVTDATAAAYAEIEESRMSDKEKALKAIQDQADAYLKAGVAEADVAKWQSEQIQKYEDEQTKTRADAYKLLESYSLSAKDKAIANIQAQADKFLEAGVSEVDVEKWKTNELDKLQEQQAEKAEEEAERVRKAWEDATWSMLGSVTSIWGSINQVQANNNAQLIATLEKTTAETLKNIDKQTQAKLEAEGVALETTEERLIRERDEALATGDEITANLKTQEIRRNEIIAEADEEKRLIEEEANKRKIDMQIEEAERDKALSTLSVILDTAKAIMQIWAEPLIAPWGKGLWTGLAAGAGAAQIAAINSAPVPSYDVGSIRIPETQTATVHKDEMILTAPQAEQARREGITIAPTNATSGRIPIQNVIYLDGKQISEAVVQYLNSGSVGTIKARVVK